MSSETQRRVRELFEVASEMPASERMTWLLGQTGGQGEVYEQAARLLQASVASGGFLAQPAWKRASPPVTEGATIGAYRVIRELGSGGMGIVYLTVRSDNVYHRLAALKVIRPELRSDPLVQRFLHEREILAQLDHPNIARIVDGGETRDGLPYFVMDYIDGLPINIFCAQRRASLNQRLNLFRQVCEAVEYLHRARIIHRDLKPANLLVTQSGVVKLLDFGIARSSGVRPGDTTGLPMLTPEYASPEQLLSRDVTFASDIYSLGAVFYELLTGQRPLKLEGMSLQDVLKAVTVTDPRQPSKVLAVPQPSGLPSSTEDLCALDPALAEIRPRLSGDLDSIVLMALHKEPERRYPSPAAMLADIDRFQQNLPVAARRDSTLYVMSKRLRRHGLRITASLVVAGSLGLGSFSTYKALGYRHEIERISSEVEAMQSRYALAQTTQPAQRAAASNPDRQSSLQPGALDLSDDLSGLTHDIQSAPPVMLSSPLAPRGQIGGLVQQSLDLFSETAPEALKNPSSAAALGRAYLAVSHLQWNPDGASLDQPEQAAETCRKALQELDSPGVQTGNQEVHQVVGLLIGALQRIPEPNK